MDFILNNEMITMPLLVAVLVGLGQMLKNLGFNPKYIPLFNIALGVCACIGLSMFNAQLGVFNGIIAGLSASGLFSGVKNIREAVKK